MASPATVPAPSQRPVTRLNPVQPQLADEPEKGAVAMLMDELITLRETVETLTARVYALECSSGPIVVKDDMPERIMTFLGSLPAGMKVTPLIVAENIGADNRVVYARMKTLTERGVLEATKEDGRTRMFSRPDSRG